jgi:hypothetical protein
MLPLPQAWRPRPQRPTLSALRATMHSFRGGASGGIVHQRLMQIHPEAAHRPARRCRFLGEGTNLRQVTYTSPAATNGLSRNARQRGVPNVSFAIGAGIIPRVLPTIVGPCLKPISTSASNASTNA